MTPDTSVEAAAALVRALTLATGRLPLLNSSDLVPIVRPLSHVEGHTELGPHNWRRPAVRPVPDDVVATEVEDPDTRVVIAAWLFDVARVRAEDYQLAHLIDRGGPFGQPPGLGLRVMGTLDVLRQFLDQHPVADVPTERLLWELHAAGLAQYEDRVLAIAERVVSEEACPDAPAIAARAVLLANARIADCRPLNAVVPDWTDPATVAQWSSSLMLVSILSPADQLSARLRGTWQSQGDGPDPAVATMVCRWLGQVESGRELSAEELAMMGWANFVLAQGGDTTAARAGADRFHATQLCIEGIEHFAQLSAAAATCCLLADDLESAESFLQLRLAMARDRNVAEVDLLRCQQRRNNTAGMITTLENIAIVKATHDYFSPPLGKLVAVYGLFERDSALARDIFLTLGSARLREPALEWLDPVQRDLSTPAQTRWRLAVYLLSSHPEREAFGEDFWPLVVRNFVVAVDEEIAHRGSAIDADWLGPSVARLHVLNDLAQQRAVEEHHAREAADLASRVLRHVLGQMLPATDGTRPRA